MVSSRLCIMCNLMPSGINTSFSPLPPTLYKKIHSPRASREMYTTKLNNSQMVTTKLT